MKKESDNLLQEFSSDSSLQSGLPLQKRSLSTHSPFPQESLPSGHTGSSVFKIGSTFLGSKICQVHMTLLFGLQTTFYVQGVYCCMIGVLYT